MPAIQITDPLWWLWQQLHALEPTTVLGGIYASKPGYHNTRSGNRSNDYSVIDAADKLGPSDKAAAIDWTFLEAQHGDYIRIARYSGRLMAAGRSNDPRTVYMREFYGQTNTNGAVEGWDFTRDVPVTSDSSHLWHIHISIIRKYVTDMTAMKAILSILKGEPMPSFPNFAGTVLRSGSTGTAVAQWQQMLNQNGAHVTVDGAFGPATLAATKAFQTAHKLPADGLVGPQTWAAGKS